MIKQNIQLRFHINTITNKVNNVVSLFNIVAFYFILFYFIAKLCVAGKLLSEEEKRCMRLWYLSHRRPAKAQASLRIRAVSPEPSLFANIKYGNRRRVRPKIRHLAPSRWLRMRVWKISLRRTKSPIISCDGSLNLFVTPLQPATDWKSMCTHLRDGVALCK